MRAHATKHPRKQKEQSALSAKWFNTYTPHTPVKHARSHVSEQYRKTSH